MFQGSIGVYMIVILFFNALLLVSSLAISAFQHPPLWLRETGRVLWFIFAGFFAFSLAISIILYFRYRPGPASTPSAAKDKN
jgi:hypothetical protein